MQLTKRGLAFLLALFTYNADAIRILDPNILFPFAVKHEAIPHECGIALFYSRKRLKFYAEKYRDPAWGLRKLYLLMEKQHNRGKDGAGLAVIKFDMPPGEQFLRRIRSAHTNAIEHIFDQVTKDLPVYPFTQTDFDESILKQKSEFLGEVYLGHLRYGTYASNTVRACQPYVRKNNILHKTFALAGNFNMSNTKELFTHVTRCGFTPTNETDTQTILDMFAYYLDKTYDGNEAYPINLADVLHSACKRWDGGYVFAGIFGNGDAFICRDPAGIRPGFILIDDEFIAAASERAALSNVFNVDPDQIQPVKPGHVLVIKKNGEILEEQFAEQLPLRQCTFERIYFSRANDPAIYKERKALGKQLAQRVFDVLGGSLERTIFSYIPNTAEPAFIGLIEELNKIVQNRNIEGVWDKIKNGTVQLDDLQTIITRAQVEKLVHKDQLVRSFITQDKNRLNLVAHLYGVTKDIVTPDDTLIVIDDSIVRGTTLRKSIIWQLSRLNPKRIIVISSAPPVMYPDCYGIDMSQIDKFIAFEAALELTKERGNEQLLSEIARKCSVKTSQAKELIGQFYDQFTLEQLEAKIAQLVRPTNLPWQGDISIIYQTIDGLHAAMPEYTGDWYFTGNYPTPGGYKMLGESYLNWYNGTDKRAY